MQPEPTSGGTSVSHSSGVSGERETADNLRPTRAVADGAAREGGLADQPPVPAELCEELHAAVEKAALRSAGSINALRMAVKRFTVALRDEGAKPETVLIALKSVINSGTFPVAVPRDEPWSPNELRQQISSWSIQEFFSDNQA